MQQQEFAFYEQSAVEIYEAIVGVLREHFSSRSRFDCVAAAFSGGKDSSLMVALTLEAARREKAQNGRAKPLVVMNSDTRVENPLVVALVKGEQGKILDHAQRHGLDVHLVTGQPTLAASWAVKVIAGNALPPIPGGKSGCTTDWKIAPLRAAMTKWLRERGLQEASVLKLTGTRFSESTERGRKMALRGESATRPGRNPSGEWLLSPIAELETDQVWELIAGMRDGTLPRSYTDFDDLLAVYSSAGGASCPLLADYRMGGVDLGSCSARTGCFVCTKVLADTSLGNMVEEHPWLKPLYALREWVSCILWDYERRSWVGRTIDRHGYIKIQPDGFSGETVADMLRYCLSIDADEDAWSAHTGKSRRFEPIIGLDGLIMIDFGWSLGGIQDRPYEAWRIYRDITENGSRYYPPVIPRCERAEVPEPRYLHVGDGWQVTRNYWGCGLRDLLAEALEADTPAAFPMRILGDGREILDIERGETASVDLDKERVWEYLDFLHWENVERANDGLISHAEAVRIYLSFGVVSHPDHGAIDMMLRRVAYRHLHGIGRNIPATAIFERSISLIEYMAQIGCEPKCENLELPLAA